MTQNESNVLFEQIPFKYFVIDKNDHLVFVSPLMMQLLSVVKDQSLQIEDLMTFFNEETDGELAKMLGQTRSDSRSAVEGKKYFFYFHLHSESGHLWGVVHRKIQDRKPSDFPQQVVGMERQKALAELAGSIAHEVNNPMTVVYTKLHFLSKLLENGKLSEEKLKEGFEAMQRNTARVIRIIKGMRSLASFGNPKNLKKTQPLDLFEETLVLLAVELQKISVLITKDFPEKVDPIHCQPTQILQALVILTKNAKDAIAEKQNPQIKFSIQQDDEFTYLSVSDNGDGVPKEIEDQIFESFFSTKGFSGNGLGLSVALKIVESHDGRLFLDRSVSDSCFKIQIPNCNDLEDNE